MAQRRPSIDRVFQDLLGGRRSGSERFRGVLDSLAPGLYGRIEAFEQRVRKEMARIEAAEPVGDPQAEAVVDMLYGYLRGLEQRPGGRRLFRKTGERLLRGAVVEIELALLPQRAQAFRLLGVHRSESVAAIKGKFRALAREHHPDRPGGDHRKMQELNRAYEIVMRIKGEV